MVEENARDVPAWSSRTATARQTIATALEKLQSALQNRVERPSCGLTAARKPSAKVARVAGFAPSATVARVAGFARHLRRGLILSTPSGVRLDLLPLPPPFAWLAGARQAVSGRRHLSRITGLSRALPSRGHGKRGRRRWLNLITYRWCSRQVM